MVEDVTWEVDINSADQKIRFIRNLIIHCRIEYGVIRDHLCVQKYYVKYISSVLVNTGIMVIFWLIDCQWYLRIPQCWLWRLWSFGMLLCVARCSVFFSDLTISWKQRCYIPSICWETLNYTLHSVTSLKIIILHLLLNCAITKYQESTSTLFETVWLILIWWHFYTCTQQQSWVVDPGCNVLQSMRTMIDSIHSWHVS